MMNRIISYTQAIQEATDQSMEKDKSVFVIGLGTTYPQACDGTVGNLSNKYPGRIFDMPCSENAATGFCIGSALTGLKPILVHGRNEFAFFGFDQIATQAAKWNYMFGGGNPIPLVIRISIGRRWGDAPQHTSALQSIYGAIPGLKVVIPSTPRSAKGLLMSAIQDNNPVICLEHRWLYNIFESVPEEPYFQPLDKCEIVREGYSITIIANSDMLIESLKCVPILKENNIDPEIIDLVSINPIDHETIIKSIEKTGILLVVDSGNISFGIGREIIGKVKENIETWRLLNIINLATPNCPCPMSSVLTEAYYPTAKAIIEAISKMFKIDMKYDKQLDFNQLHLPQKEDIDKLKEGL